MKDNLAEYSVFFSVDSCDTINEWASFNSASRLDALEAQY